MSERQRAYAMIVSAIIVSFTGQVWAALAVVALGCAWVWVEGYGRSD